MFHCHASVAYLCKNGRLACGRTLIFDMYGDDDMMADLLFAVSIVVVLRLDARCIATGVKKQDNDRLNGRWRVSPCKAFFSFNDVSERCFA